MKPIAPTITRILSFAFLIPMSLAAAYSQAKSDAPSYPRVNVAPVYEVDPNWPRIPEHCKWAEVPGIAVDASDQVWIFTRTNPPVQVYTSDGKFVRSWGEGLVGKAHHIKIDREGNVWLSDVGLHVVRKCSPGGTVLLTLGTPGEKGSDETHFNMPTDMTVAPGGDVFVSDGYGNARVVHFDKRGKFVKAWGSIGSGPGQFSLPHAITLDSRGRLYVADRNNVRVQVFNQEGRLLNSWAGVIVPWGFCMTAEDTVWVCGSSPMAWRDDPNYPGAPLGCPPKDQVLMRFNTAGRLIQLWTVPKGEDGVERAGELNWVHCVAVDSKGSLYAGDIIGKRAQKFIRKN